MWTTPVPIRYYLYKDWVSPLQNGTLVKLQCYPQNIQYIPACPVGPADRTGVVDPPEADRLPPLKVRDLRLELEQKLPFFKGLEYLPGNAPAKAYDAFFLHWQRVVSSGNLAHIVFKIGLRSGPLLPVSVFAHLECAFPGNQHSLGPFNMNNTWPFLNSVLLWVPYFKVSLWRTLFISLFGRSHIDMYSIFRPSSLFIRQGL